MVTPRDRLITAPRAFEFSKGFGSDFISVIQRDKANRGCEIGVENWKDGKQIEKPRVSLTPSYVGESWGRQTEQTGPIRTSI